MALTAKELLDEARSHHPEFIREVVPDKVLLGHLSTVERRLVQQIAPLNEQAISKTFVAPEATITAALATGGGIPLPQLQTVTDALVRCTDGSEFPLALVASRAELSVHHFPTAVHQGGRLYPTDLTRRGSAETGWKDALQIRLRYVPVPARLATLSDELVLPELASPALVDALVAFLATHRRVTREMPGVRERADESAGLLLSALADQMTSATWHVRTT